MYSQLEQYFLDAYSEPEYPTLRLQREKWITSKPFAGLSILDATPMCRNSIYKYMNLIYGGARLSVGRTDISSVDERLCELLYGAGIAVVTPQQNEGEYDIIMDCAAQFLDTKARLGRVELTRSGSESYRQRNEAVYMADGGKIKLIETCIGTGEGYFRAMESLGYTVWQDKELLLMGCGKVGQGILRSGVDRGAQVTVVTDASLVGDNIREKCARVIDYRDREAVEKAALESYALVSATGQIGAVGRTIEPRTLIESDLLLANMGAEDEFGESFPDSRVLAEKGSLNFILKDPTSLKYIDATLALHNYGAVYVIENPQMEGIVTPDQHQEDQLLRETLHYGIISEDLVMLSEAPYNIDIEKLK